MINSKPIQLTRRALRGCTGGKADQRGSAIVLVLVSIVLMAVLAATLLQVTRFERIPRPVSNIDIVVESVIDEILSQGTDDLLDDNGDMFNPRFTLNNGVTNGGGDEAWDFPWTNPAIVGARRPDLIGGGQATDIIGGAMDDPWIASTAPDFRTTLPANSVRFTNTNNIRGVWPKITSLTGVYLGGASGSRDLSTTARGDRQPVEYHVNTTNPGLNSDMNVAIPAANNPNGVLVDADGDGIGDSRWEWAPIRQIGTTRYTMAVRIIDLSARMDLNVATGMYGASSGFGGGALGAGLSRGDNPSELDGSGFVALMADASASGINGAAARAEWRNVLGYRLFGNPAVSISATPGILPYDGNSDPPAGASRRDYWERGASRVSPTFTRYGEVRTPFDYSADATFGLVDAFELLQRNGLNSSNTAAIEERMPDFLRNGAAENNFVTGPTPNGWTQRQFWQLDPRKHVTPFSGAMAIRRPIQLGMAREAKLDINEAVKTAAGVRELRNTIRDTLDIGSSASLRLRFRHLAAAGTPTSTDLANQLTANIVDYIDEDNTVTIVDGKAGLEALPYITEAYIQRPFIAGAIQPPPPTNPAGPETAVWLSQAPFEVGYAIEIGNPFASKASGSWTGRPVSLENVYIKLNSTTEVELSSLPGVPTDNKLDPGEVLIIRRDSAGNTATPSQDDLSNLYATGMTIHEADVTTDARFDWPTRGTTVNFQLVCETVSGGGGTTSIQNRPYSAVETETSRNIVTESVTPGSVIMGAIGYVQTSYQGFGDGLRMMTVTARPQSAITNAVGFNDDVTTLDKPSMNSDAMGAPQLTIVPSLGDENKANGPTGFASLDKTNQQIVLPDNPRERMNWVGDILQIPLIGPDFSAVGNASVTAIAFNRTLLRTFPQNLPGIELLMLPYKTDPAVQPAPVGTRSNLIDGDPNANFGVYTVPHSILLLEQLTAFNPAMDGEDGDDEGDSATESPGRPDEDELLVAGKINLNTATFETLVRLLPYPNAVIRSQVANAIIARRESLRQFTDYQMGANDLPGIAYTSGLLEQIEGSNTLATDGVSNNSIDSVRVDWNDHENPIGTLPGGLDDGVIDDREEELMLGKWLTEIADNRSDVFAAYIVVQGYPADDFTAGAIESARLIVIFSRANVEGQGDQAIEIGRFRFQ